MKICSACLLGIRCRFDGEAKPDEKILYLAKKEPLIPVCPEQLGGLPTPREPAELKNNKAITKSGKDVTFNFEKGAQEVLKLAELFGAKTAILKQRSASCGSGEIYDGTFSGKVVQGDGITAALLKARKIEVIAVE